LDSKITRGLTSFLRYLNSHPAPDAIIKALVHGPLAEYGARSGSLLVKADDGLAVIADYASPGNLLARYHVLPLSIDIPYTRAFLNGECLITRGSDIFEHFPALAIDADLWDSSGLAPSASDLVSVPIASQGVGIGAFGFVTDTDRDWRPSDFGLLEALAAVLGLWLTHPSSGVRTGTPSPWATDEGETLQLSARQLAVLQFLAKDKTNDFIAATLGVSVSTVKQDVQRILRALRSPDRRAAVVHAIALGILQPQ